MTDSRSSQPYYARRHYRLVTGVFGLFLLGVGIYVARYGYASMLVRIAVGAVLVLIGGNMLVATHRSRVSWLSRLGPLP